MNTRYVLPGALFAVATAAAVLLLLDSEEAAGVDSSSSAEAPSFVRADAVRDSDSFPVEADPDRGALPGDGRVLDEADADWRKGFEERELSARREAKAAFDVSTATTKELERAIALGWLTRGELGDAAFDALLGRIAGQSLARLSEERESRFIEHFTSTRPLSAIAPGMEISDSLRAEARAIEQLFEPQRRELAGQAAASLRRCLEEYWAEGRYATWQVGTAREDAPWTEEELMAGYRMSSSTAVHDRAFQLRFSSIDYPQLEASLKELKELSGLVDAELRRLLEKR